MTSEHVANRPLRLFSPHWSKVRNAGLRQRRDERYWARHNDTGQQLVGLAATNISGRVPNHKTSDAYCSGVCDRSNVLKPCFKSSLHCLFSGVSAWPEGIPSPYVQLGFGFSVILVVRVASKDGKASPVAVEGCLRLILKALVCQKGR